ncbi:FecCD family ABC transporter permease [Anaerosacchariphilus polymeriproducens]|nr:iron ABC transporter permease [Anaerosacchariphilus polymeriproducens]
MKIKAVFLTRFFFISMCLILIMNICVVYGSVDINLWDTGRIVFGAITGKFPSDIPERFIPIVLGVRLPRVLMSGLVGASLSISGAAMQGLLKNPLADGTTIGVSSGASLGAVIAIAFSAKSTLVSGLGTFLMSILFSFASICLILFLAKIIDFTLSTNTVILIGVIYSMFASSITSLITTLADKEIKNIVFWSMGSIAGSTYEEVVLMTVILIICSFVLMRNGVELNAFAIGEENAMHVGVDVRRVKLRIMALVSILIGVSVSISGTIGFVGLVIPHITRIFTGPNHKKLLPISMAIGAGFLMLADMFCRTMFSPIELPIGIITSFIGSILFVFIMIRKNSNKFRG